LKSELLSDTYRVDGRADEWKGKNMLSLKDDGLLVGVQNDATNIYVCLMSTDRSTAWLMTTVGMVIWIEPEHGKKFGIHYPLHVGRPSAAAGVDAKGYRTEMEILGPEKDAVTQSSILTSESDYGITTAVHDSSGFTILEMKIPRKAKQEPYGAGIDNTLSMTVESGKIEKPSGGKHQGGGMGSGGRRRRGGSSPSGDMPTEGGGTANNNGTQSSDYSGSGRGSNGDRGSEAKTPHEPISFSLRVHLVQ
jgi:hypothetical protein